MVIKNLSPLNLKSAALIISCHINKYVTLKSLAVWDLNKYSFEKPKYLSEELNYSLTWCTSLYCFFVHCSCVWILEEETWTVSAVDPVFLLTVAVIHVIGLQGKNAKWNWVGGS